MFKGQSEIMEYLLMVVFIVAVVIGIIIFLTWWNVTQLEMEGSKNRQDRVLAIGQHMMADYMFINKESMLDDAKLTSINAAQACDKLEEIFGTNWYAKIKSLDMEGEITCTWNDYPNCNVWNICNYKEHPNSRSAQNFPVNVYRKVSDKTALAVLHVEVYS